MPASEKLPSGLGLGLAGFSKFSKEKDKRSWVKMEDLAQTDSVSATKSSESQRNEMVRAESSTAIQPNGPAEEEPARRSRNWLRRNKNTYSHTHYKVYRRRWFGLLQLVLMNIVVSWDWLTFAPVSASAATYFDVSETAINWLSTGFLFAFIAISPVTMAILNRGPKQAIIWCACLLFIGNWLRYAGTVRNIFGLVMVGQIFTGLAQPFVLAAPTRYSDLWFTESGRVSATALASLANPFGGAVCSLESVAFGAYMLTTI